MNSVYDGVLIRQSEYRSIVDTLKKREDMGEAALLLIEQGLSGERLTSEDPAINMLLSMSFPLQVTARQRYASAKENGKLGGRPQSVNREHVLALRRSGYTQKQIADEIGCSVSTVQSILSRCDMSDMGNHCGFEPTHSNNAPVSQYSHEPNDHPWVAEAQEDSPFDDDGDVPF